MEFNKLIMLIGEIGFAHFIISYRFGNFFYKIG